MLQIFEGKNFHNISLPDIFYTPKYIEIFSKYEDGEPLFFYYENDKGKVFSPFIKRKIKSNNFFDISTPYGCGGLLVESQDKHSLTKEFYKELKIFLLDNKIVAEFGRLHPYFFDKSLIQENFITNFVTFSVFIDLREKFEKIVKNLRRDHRARIKRAIKEGVEVKISREDRDIEIFYTLYIETMRRKNARDFYFFPLWLIKELVSSFENAYIFIAFLKEIPISSSLFLSYNKFFHYFLTGSNFNYRNYGGNRIIIYEAIKFAKEKGFEIMHLGGGMKGEDELFLFKSGFSNWHLPYYVYGVIHNEKVYNELVEERKKMGPIKDEFFFPLYRAPL
ncbi:MAG: GNAT family N-acetyltransferase [candidate division WOR-3 bacterium]